MEYYKEEWCTDTWYNRDEPREHHANGKLDMNGHILYDSSYMKYPGKEKP